MWRYWLPLLMIQVLPSQARFFEAKTPQEKAIYKSHKVIQQWEKALTPEEKVYMADLLKMHSQLHDDHKTNPSAKTAQMLQQMHEVVENNMIPNWNFFYKPYVHAQMFEKSYQTWKARLPVNQLRKHSGLLQAYDRSYQEYLKNPKSISIHQRLLELQGNIKAIMNN